MTTTEKIGNAIIGLRN